MSVIEGFNYEKQEKYILDMHYNTMMRSDYETLIVESILLQCKLNDINYMKTVKLSECDADARTEVNVRLAEVRKSLKEMNTILDKMADATRMYNSRKFGYCPTPATEHFSETIKRAKKSEASRVDGN